MSTEPNRLGHEIMIDHGISPKIAVISTVHETYDTRIFYKQIFSLKNNYNIIYFSPTLEKPKYDWIVSLYKSRSKIGRIRTHLSLIRQLPRFSVDIYVLHDPELLLLGIALKCFAKKVVWDMHEDTYNDIKTKIYLKPFARTVLAFVYKWIQAISYKLLDGFILAEDEYQSYFTKAGKTCIVHNYPLLDQLSNYPETLKEPGTMAYIGSISVNRGVYQLLDLVVRLKKDLPTIRLALIGPFVDASLEASVRQHVSDMHIEENIQFYGFIKNVEAYFILAKCMIGLALLLPEPNFTKSLPTKMFEYMALGLPVVVSNFPLWENIVKNRQVGFVVDPLDTASAAKFISRILVDENLYREFSRNAIKAAQEYSWETEYKILQDFLANVLVK